MKKKTDLYIGLGVIVVAVLNLFGVLGMVGVTQRFVDIVLIVSGLYLIYKAVK